MVVVYGYNTYWSVMILLELIYKFNHKPGESFLTSALSTMYYGISIVPKAPCCNYKHDLVNVGVGFHNHPHQIYEVPQWIRQPR